MTLHDNLVLLDQPTLQVLEAALALGGAVAPAHVSALIGADAEPHLARAVAAGLASRHGDQVLVDNSLREIFVRPLGVGAPVRQHLERLTAEDLRVIARNLGLPVKGRKADLFREISRFFHSPDELDSLLKRMPASTRSLLAQVDQAGGRVAHHEHLGPLAYRRPKLDRRVNALEWAEEHGLVYNTSWYEFEIAGEVALALRGPDYHAPLRAEAPAVEWVTPDAAAIDRDARAQGMVAVRLLAALLDEAGRTPLVTVKAGGVGVRELTRVAKFLDTTPEVVRLLLAIACEAGLVKLDDRVTPTRAYDAWSNRETGPRLAAMLRAWLALEYVPATQSGPWLPEWGVGWARTARITALEALAERGARDLDAVARWVWWRSPLSFGHVRTVRCLLDEAAFLGATGAGVLSEAGRALVNGADVTKAVGDLGTVVHKAHLQADLTATAAGTPSGELAELLGAVATVESRGTATTWRFRPNTIRAAYDAGWTEAKLAARLTQIADGALPQPLAYLLADVARQHGSVRVAPAESTLVSDDSALLKQVCADTKLTRLGLRLLAPTVLAAQAPSDEVLAALRKAGYSPKPQDARGNDIIERARRHRA
jgi:hypothetical protein